MEQRKNQKRMIEISAELFEETGSLARKDKSTFGDKVSIPSFRYKAPVHKHIYTNGVHIECDNNEGTGSTNKTSTVPKKTKITAVKNIRLKDLQQNCRKGEFINIHEASSNVVFRPVCPHCRKILATRETLVSHFKVCRQRYIYACEKCSFVTRNKSDLVSHQAGHAPIECPKCSLLFENKKLFIDHYHEVCKETRPEKQKIYTCEVCAFSTNQMSVLKCHMQLHPVDSETIPLGRNTCPSKETNNKFGQTIVVVTAKSLYAKEYDEVADTESLPLSAESHTVEQNSPINSLHDQNIIDTLISTNRDHAYSKNERIASENSTNLNCTDVYGRKSSTSEIVCTNEGLNLGIDDSIIENFKNLNEHVEVYGKQSSSSEIVCTNEGLNPGIDKRIPSKNFEDLNEHVEVIIMYKKQSTTSQTVCTDEGLNPGIDKKISSENFENLNEHVEVYGKKSNTSGIVSTNEGLSHGIDERIASKNPKNRDKHADVYRKQSTTSQTVCTNQGLNLGIDRYPRCKEKCRDKIIVRYCQECKETYEIGNYCEWRPLCNFCDSKLHLKCTQCDKVMKEYFDAIEHLELECDKHETLYTHRQVELPPKQKSPSQTDRGSNLCIDKLPSVRDNGHKKKIIRYCKKCKKGSDFICYYEKRPRCIDCQKKLLLKCVLCCKLMTEYFVAIEHTELKCNQKKRLNKKQCTVYSSFSKDRNHDDNETEKEIAVEHTDSGCNQKKQTEYEIFIDTSKKRASRIIYDIKSAKVTKICPKCNITAEFDVTSRCKTCYRGCTFQCNRCKKDFENYQKVSKHLWTQCLQEGFYHCLKCTFKSPTRFIVRRHCEKHHPEFSDPLGSAKEGDYIEYRGTQSNENANWLPQNFSYQPKKRKSTMRIKNDKTVPARYSRTCQHCVTTFSSHRNFIKHLVHCMKPHVFACEYCPFTTKTKVDLRNHVLSYHLNLPSISADSLVNTSGNRSTDSPPYKCRFCSHVSQRRTALQMHEGLVHSDELQELLEMKESNGRKTKVYQCNACSCQYVDRLGELKQHILKIHMKGQDASRLPPCARCGWDFQSLSGLKKHLAYCGKKLDMQCRVNLVRLNMKPAISNDNLAETIKEEAVDLGEFHMEVDT